MGEIQNLPQKPLDSHPPKVYSVPRRFGIGTMMGVATAYGLAIWFMQQLDAPPQVIIVNAFFLTIVGAMQMVMNKTPRWASIGVGVACIFWMLVFSIFRYGNTPGLFDVAMVAIVTAIVGPIYGYLGGTMVAGVFLIIDAGASNLFPKRNDEENVD